MAKVATRNRLAGRLAACQMLGTVVGLLLAGAAGRIVTSQALSISGFSLTLVAALVFGIPFYAAAVLVLHNWTRSILSHPLIWCIGIPCAMLAMALCVFPPTADGVFWVDLIPLCALCAGVLFTAWQKKSPLVYVR